MNDHLWHHGKCDCCNIQDTLVLHLGYITQPDRDYRLCLKCLKRDANNILYGWMDYKVDHTIDKITQSE